MEQQHFLRSRRFEDDLQLPGAEGFFFFFLSKNSVSSSSSACCETSPLLSEKWKRDRFPTPPPFLLFSLSLRFLFREDSPPIRSSERNGTLIPSSILVVFVFFFYCGSGPLRHRERICFPLPHPLLVRGLCHKRFSLLFVVAEGEERFRPFPLLETFSFLFRVSPPFRGKKKAPYFFDLLF